MLDPLPPDEIALPQKPRRRWGHHPFWAGSVLIMVAAMFPPALQMRPIQGSDPIEPWPGFAYMLVGWLGFLVGQIGWLANIAWFSSIITTLLRLHKTTLILSVLACLLGLTTYSLFGAEIPMDTSGLREMTLVALLPGFYLWYAALVVPGVWGLIRLVTKRL